MELEALIGEAVLKARRRRHMTQVEFAIFLRSADPGGRKWLQADISELERGRFDARVSELKTLAVAVGKPVEWFLSGGFDRD